MKLRAKYGIWRTRPTGGQRGVTLLEMIVVITILLILMGAAAPVMKVSVIRGRETD
jgi:prepilin-type N-terminal cleavage/methylation domain-containing protein